MRLRTLLALTFLGLSLLQVAVVAPFALKNLDALLEAQRSSRVEQSMEAAATFLNRLDADVRHSMDELAQSVALDEVAKDVTQVPAPASVKDAALPLLEARGLKVLSLLDAQGHTLSSAHFPAHLGELDPALFAVTQQPAQTVVATLIEVRDNDGLSQAPAWVTARPVDDGEHRIWAVGGTLLDASVADALAKLTGAQVVIDSGVRTVSSGAAAEPVVEKTISLGPANLRLLFSRADTLAARAEVVRAFAALAGLSVLLAVAVGAFWARRLTRPLEALTDAARQVGVGDATAPIEERGARELRELLHAFNRMTADLATTTEKLIASERLAAWQEVARRLAHEIKNPLTPIRMSLETLHAAAQKDPSRFMELFRESAPAVLEEVDRLRRVVDEFSQFARLPKPRLARLEIAEWARSVLSLYADHTLPNGAKLTYRSELNAAHVNADRDLLTQVLVNLVKNAEEAMGDKGGAITVRTQANATEVSIEVDDEGPGVPAAMRARLFEPYATSKPDGSGLGLSIAQRIMQEHSGRLELVSVERGARFRAVLSAG